MYMSHPTKGKRISPSLVNREPLPNAIFGTVDERNRYVVQMREVGHTLQAIGDSLSLTREMIRLIVKANAGPSARTVRVNREAKKQREALDTFKELRTADVETLAAHLDEKPERVRQLLGKQAKKLPKGRMNFEKILAVGIKHARRPELNTVLRCERATRAHIAKKTCWPSSLHTSQIHAPTALRLDMSIGNAKSKEHPA